MAKRLIAETELPMVQVALAAGFDSLRRFNATFRSHYRLAPSKLRRSALKGGAVDCLRLVLSYRPPLDWAAMLRFLEKRAIPGVECVTDDAYHRTVGIGEYRGRMSVSPVAGRNLLSVDLSTALTPVLPAILVRLRNLFDLDARPDIIAGHLALDPRLSTSAAQHAGLRVPGAFDSFELGMRAILGQQVSVRGASTLAGRFATRFGETIKTPLACLHRVTPTAESIATAHRSTIAGLGLPLARAECLRNLARAVVRREIDLDPGGDPATTAAKLKNLAGIGPWTAEYIAMRALRWPDAFPTGDLGLLKAARVKSATALEAASARWRPWRAYAAMHLWENLQSSAKWTFKHSKEQ
jgi:AraC family transcriptional regulator of adaptative response / DNA-3-methyladenine glycosylase II